MEKELQKIGHRIKLLRIENKISQKVLAKKLCISQTHLSNAENGRVMLSLKAVSYTHLDVYKRQLFWLLLA